MTQIPPLYSQILRWLSTAGWSHLVEALLHTLWIGAVIALALTLLLQKLRTPSIRYRFCSLALAGILGSGLITWSILQEKSNHSAPTSNTASTKSNPSPSTTTASGETILVPSVLSVPSPHSTPTQWIPILALTWLIGLTLMMSRAIRQVTGAESLRRSCKSLDDPTILQLIETTRAKLKLARRIRVAVTDRLASPAVMGVIIPTLILPLSLITTLTTKQIEFILLHELAHVRRGDYLANLCQMLAESLLFFNPAIWWISRQMRQEREACCDAIAISLAGGPVEYARTLADVASTYLSPSAAVPAFGDRRNPSGLRDRIRRLLEPGYRPSLRLTWKAVILSLVTGTILLTLSALGTRWTVSAAITLLTPEQRIQAIERVTASNEVMEEMDQEKVPHVKVSVHIRTKNGEPLPKNISTESLTVRNRSSSGRAGYVSPKTGRFEETLLCGRIYFAAWANNYAVSSLGPIDALTTNAITNLELTLEPGFDVPIRAEEADTHAPLPNARLRVSFWMGNSSFGPQPELTTGSDGVATFHHLISSRISVHLEAPGFESSDTPFDAPKLGEPLKITAVSGLPTTGLVFDKTTGQPIADAKIYLTGSYQRLYQENQSTGEPLAKTGPDGRFTIRTLRRDDETILLADAPGFALTLLPKIRGGQTGITFKMGPILRINGTITGDLNLLKKLNGLPILDVNRSIITESHSFGSSISCPVRVENGVGHFTFTNAAAGSAKVEITGQTFPLDINEPVADWKIALTSPGVKPPAIPTRTVILHFDYPPGPAPHGKMNIVVQGKIPHTAENREATVTNGEARLEAPLGFFGYEEGHFIGYWFGRNYSLTISTGNGPQIVHIPTVPAGAIQGRAKNADGTPASDVSFSIYEVKKSPLLPDQSNYTPPGDSYSSGEGPRRYVASPVPLGGTYLAVASRKNSHAVSEPIKLTEETPIAQFETRFAPGVSFDGRVLGPDGQPLPGATVTAEWKYKDHSFGGSSVLTDVTGAFRLNDLTPSGGQYILFVKHPGLRDAQQDIKLNGKPVTIQLEKGLTLSGQVLEDKSGLPVISTEIRAVHKNYTGSMAYVHTDDTGHFQFDTLEDDEYMIFVDSAYEYQAHPKLYQAGKDANIIIRAKSNEGAHLRVASKP